MHSQHHPNMDAATSAYFSGQLVTVRNTVYEMKYPEFLARNFVPVVPGNFGRNTDIVISRALDAVGTAKILASYADDLPRVDEFGTEQFARVRPLGDAYGWDIFEVEKAAQEQRDLPTRKSGLARRAIEALMDTLLLKGDADFGMKGLANQTSALTYVLPNGAGGSAKWIGAGKKVAAEIAADMVALVNYSESMTNGYEIADTLLMPSKAYEIAATTQYSAASDTTVLEWFRKVTENRVQVFKWGLLTAANLGIAGDRMIAYRRDPEAVEGVIPREFEQLDPQPKNLEVVVPCHARCGGVIAHRPLSIAYADGATVNGA